MCFRARRCGRACLTNARALDIATRRVKLVDGLFLIFETNILRVPPVKVVVKVMVEVMVKVMDSLGVVLVAGSAEREAAPRSQ